jgi:hypothetical protein
MEQRVGQLEGMVTQLAAALQTADARSLAAEQLLANAQAATTTTAAPRAGNVDLERLEISVPRLLWRGGAEVERLAHAV